jgi:hypothetical protein
MNHQSINLDIHICFSNISRHYFFVHILTLEEENEKKNTRIIYFVYILIAERGFYYSIYTWMYFNSCTDISIQEKAES